MTQAAPAPIPAISPMLEELRHESATTRRVLDGVPGDKLDWKPCGNGLTAGQLAFHLAGILGLFASVLKPDTFEPPNDAFTFKPATSKEEILSTFDAGLKAAEQYLATISDEQARAPWTTVNQGRTILQMPRANAVRMLMLNHSIHHRGQLALYLREMGAHVPAIYGPSGDENPFAPK